MKLVVVTIAGIAVGITVAYAESKKPQQMTEAQMEQVYAGSPPKGVGGGVGTALLKVATAVQNSNEGRGTASSNANFPVGLGKGTASQTPK